MGLYKLFFTYFLPPSSKKNKTMTIPPVNDSSDASSINAFNTDLAALESLLEQQKTSGTFDLDLANQIFNQIQQLLDTYGASHKEDIQGFLNTLQDSGYLTELYHNTVAAVYINVYTSTGETEAETAAQAEMDRLKALFGMGDSTTINTEDPLSTFKQNIIDYNITKLKTDYTNSTKFVFQRNLENTLAALNDMHRTDTGYDQQTAQHFLEMLEKLNQFTQDHSEFRTTYENLVNNLGINETGSFEDKQNRLNWARAEEITDSGGSRNHIAYLIIDENKRDNLQGILQTASNPLNTFETFATQDILDELQHTQFDQAIETIEDLQQRRAKQALLAYNTANDTTLTLTDDQLQQAETLISRDLNPTVYFQLLQAGQDPAVYLSVTQRIQDLTALMSQQTATFDPSLIEQILTTANNLNNIFIDHPEYKDAEIEQIFQTYNTYLTRISHKYLLTGNKLSDFEQIKEQLKQAAYDAIYNQSSEYDTIFFELREIYNSYLPPELQLKKNYWLSDSRWITITCITDPDNWKDIPCKPPPSSDELQDLGIDPDIYQKSRDHVIYNCNINDISDHLNQLKTKLNITSAPNTTDLLYAFKNALFNTSPDEILVENLIRQFNSASSTTFSIAALTDTQIHTIATNSNPTAALQIAYNNSFEKKVQALRTMITSSTTFNATEATDIFNAINELNILFGSDPSQQKILREVFTDANDYLTALYINKVKSDLEALQIARKNLSVSYHNYSYAIKNNESSDEITRLYDIMIEDANKYNELVPPEVHIGNNGILVNHVIDSNNALYTETHNKLINASKNLLGAAIAPDVEDPLYTLKSTIYNLPATDFYDASSIRDFINSNGLTDVAIYNGNDLSNIKITNSKNYLISGLQIAEYMEKLNNLIKEQEQKPFFDADLADRIFNTVQQITAHPSYDKITSVVQELSEYLTAVFKNYAAYEYYANGETSAEAKITDLQSKCGLLIPNITNYTIDQLKTEYKDLNISSLALRSNAEISAVIAKATHISNVEATSVSVVGPFDLAADIQNFRDLIEQVKNLDTFNASLAEQIINFIPTLTAKYSKYQKDELQQELNKYQPFLSTLYLNYLSYSYINVSNTTTTTTAKNVLQTKIDEFKYRFNIMQAPAATDDFLANFKSTIINFDADNIIDRSNFFLNDIAAFKAHALQTVQDALLPVDFKADLQNFEILLSERQNSLTFNYAKNLEFFNFLSLLNEKYADTHTEELTQIFDSLTGIVRKEDGSINTNETDIQNSYLSTLIESVVGYNYVMNGKTAASQCLAALQKTFNTAAISKTMQPFQTNLNNFQIVNQTASLYATDIANNLFAQWDTITNTLTFPSSDVNSATRQTTKNFLNALENFRKMAVNSGSSFYQRSYDNFINRLSGMIDASEVNNGTYTIQKYLDMARAQLIQEGQDNGSLQHITTKLLNPIGVATGKLNFILVQEWIKDYKTEAADYRTLIDSIESPNITDVLNYFKEIFSNNYVNTGNSYNQQTTQKLLDSLDILKIMGANKPSLKNVYDQILTRMQSALTKSSRAEAQAYLDSASAEEITKTDGTRNHIASLLLDGNTSLATDLQNIITQTLTQVSDLDSDYQNLSQINIAKEKTLEALIVGKLAAASANSMGSIIQAVYSEILNQIQEQKTESISSKKLTDLLGTIFNKGEDLQREIGSLGDTLGLMSKGNDLVASITNGLDEYINFVKSKVEEYIQKQRTNDPDYVSDDLDMSTVYNDLSPASKEKAAELVHGIIDPLYGTNRTYNTNALDYNPEYDFSKKISLRVMAKNYEAIFPNLKNKYNKIIDAFKEIPIGNTTLADTLNAYSQETNVHGVESKNVAEVLFNNIGATPKATDKVNSITLGVNAVGTYFNSQNTKLQLEVQTVTNTHNELITFIKTAWQALFDIIKNMIEKMSR